MAKQYLKKAEMKKWTDALRSGDFEQARGRLCISGTDGTCTYCALGVALAIGLAEDAGPCRLAYNFLNLHVQDKIIELNDDEGYSFKRIADWIEKNYKSWKRPE